MLISYPMLNHQESEKKLVPLAVLAEKYGLSQKFLIKLAREKRLKTAVVRGVFYSSTDLLKKALKNLANSDEGLRDEQARAFFYKKTLADRGQKIAESLADANKPINGFSEPDEDPEEELIKTWLTAAEDFLSEWRMSDRPGDKTGTEKMLAGSGLLAAKRSGMGPLMIIRIKIRESRIIYSAVFSLAVAILLSAYSPSAAFKIADTADRLIAWPPRAGANVAYRLIAPAPDLPEIKVKPTTDTLKRFINNYSWYYRSEGNFSSYTIKAEDLFGQVAGAEEYYR